MTWEPLARDCRMIAVVADPDEKASACFPCSRAPIAVSKLVLFGLALLVYSYSPTGTPIDFWA